MAHDGECKNYAPNKHQLGTHRYSDGQAYCKACERWMIWNGGEKKKITKSGEVEIIIVSKLFCPCCGHRLRLHSRKKTIDINQCVKCKATISHMGKRNQWFTWRKKMYCATCYFKKVPPTCDDCEITEEDQINTYGTVKWVFPNAGGILCKQCSSKKWYTKKSFRVKALF